MTSGNEILELLTKNRKKIKSFGVMELGVFGSFARGDQTEQSDVDVSVELEKETFSASMEVLFFLEGLFDRKVDLVMKDSIKPIIRDRVLSETIYVKGF